MNIWVIGAVAAGAWLLLRKRPPPGAMEFDVGLQGPAALPNTDEVINSLFQALKVDPATVADAAIELAPGSATNVLRFVTRTGSPVPVLPPIGTNLTVAGVPLQVVSIEHIAVPATLN